MESFTWEAASGLIWFQVLCCLRALREAPAKNYTPNQPLMSLCKTPPPGFFFCLSNCDLLKPPDKKMCSVWTYVWVANKESMWRLWCRQPTVCKEGLLTPFRMEVLLKGTKVLQKKIWRKSKWQSKKCEKTQNTLELWKFSQDLENVILWYLGWVYWIKVQMEVFIWTFNLSASLTSKFTSKLSVLVPGPLYNISS